MEHDTLDYIWVFCETCDEEYQIPDEENYICPICLETADLI